MKFIDYLRNRQTASLHDAVMVPVAWFLAFWLRFNLEEIPPQNLDAALYGLLIILPVQVAVMWWLGLYRGVWRFASLPDLLRIIKAVIFGVGISMLFIFALTRLEAIPRSVPLLYGFMLIGLLSGPRFVYRWITDRRLYTTTGKRVMIIGAGRAGEMLARDLLRDPHHQYQPVLFVDEDQRKVGREIQGIRVLGDMARVKEYADFHEVDIIILAMPSMRSKQMRRVIELCEGADLPIRTLPRLPDLVSGQVSLNALRKVSIEDLLGRDPVELDWDRINNSFNNRVVLVTGGGGSIGSELCRQIARLTPSRLVLVDNSEYNLYQIEQELSETYPDLEIRVHLNNATDFKAIDNIMRAYRPSVVFHAAAYKHVPMLQNQVRTAVYNNVLGTRVVACAADLYKVESFVLISTDKAVNPTNVMGTTKRICEMFCKKLDTQSETKFITVRFGNVLGSAGSVVPLFEKQIASGGPVTVTHPDITRYFMTIPEACQLILQADSMGKGGETFVLDMGEPVKISYLAEQMISLAGKIPGEDIEIIYTGLRPGEKLYEELFYDRERLVGTSHEKIQLSRYRDNLDNVMELVDTFRTACDEDDEVKLIRLLHELVPEYTEMEEDSPSSSNVIPFQDRKPG